MSSLLNFTTNDFRNELSCKLGKTASSSLSLDDLGHLLPDSTNLRRAGICRFLDLVRASLGEGNAKETNKIVVGGLNGNVGLNQGLPLSHEGPQLISSEVQSMKVRQAVFALDLVHTKFDFPECMVFVVLQISEGYLENTALQIIIRIFETAGSVDNGLPDASIQLAELYIIRVDRSAYSRI